MKSHILLALALAAMSPTPAAAHLMVTEVGYDTVDETAPTSEFLEIVNPGPDTVSVANVWVANDEEAYPGLVNGPMSSGITLFDFVYRLPPILLEPGRILVICQDSDAFLAEHFAGSFTAFAGQPGNPILVEATQDGAADGVPDLIDYGSNEQGTLSMANNGECVGLVEWDGVSDRITDHDWVCWLTMNNVPDKDIDYPFGIDGPDPDFDTSFFENDHSNGVPAPDAPQGSSIHRTSMTEPAEIMSGGNGIEGHDETSEDWSAWEVAAYSPGTTSLVTVGVESGGFDSGLRLHLSRPNPFSTRMTLSYVLPSAGRVHAAVLDVAGRQVATLVDEDRPAGAHTTVWDGHDATGRRMNGGVFFVRLRFGGEVLTRRLVFVR